MTDLTLYTHPNSRGRIARWMLEETGAAYATHWLDYGGAMHGADYAAINPMKKVPAIKHGDRVVCETAAVIAYLADAFPDAGLAPDLKDRADYYRWLFFAAGPWEAATTNKALGVKISAEQQGFAGYGDFDRVMDVVEAKLEKDDYVAAGRFTAADVYLGAQVSFGLHFKTIEPRPAFLRYVERLTVRPAYVRAAEIDDAKEKESAA